MTAGWGNGSGFWQGERGSIAPLFALSIFVIFGAIGLGVDGARGYGAKSHLQNAVDAAVLATARKVSEQPSTDVTAYFTTIFNASKPAEQNFSINSLAVTKVGNSVEAIVEASLPAVFMSVVGLDRISLASASTAEFGFGDIEVVLALDNTGSMTGSKIASLKTAASGLVDTLSRNAPTPDKLRVGLVPFAKYVNVGMSNRNASWIDVPTDYTTTSEWCGNTYPNATYSNCRMVSGACTLDGVASTCRWETCDTNYGEPVYRCQPYTETFTWNGCVGSRRYPLNVQDGSYGTRVPGLLNAYCPAEMTPLTTDRDRIRSAIDGMAADGDTYIPEGLMWGWRALSPGEPFSESQSGVNNRVRRYLVLMTDGINSVSPAADGQHSGSDTSQANTYTQEVCSNIKAEGISIFTIAFEVGDNSIKDVLRNCASAGGFFFDASSSSELTAAFDTIGQQMVNLRIKR